MNGGRMHRTATVQFCLKFQDGERTLVLADYWAVVMNAPQEKHTGQAPHPQTPETPSPPPEERPREIGGRDGPEPTRYGDWEKAGRCIDF